MRIVKEIVGQRCISSTGRTSYFENEVIFMDGSKGTTYHGITYRTLENGIEAGTSTPMSENRPYVEVSA